MNSSATFATPHAPVRGLYATGWTSELWGWSGRDRVAARPRRLLRGPRAAGLGRRRPRPSWPGCGSWRPPLGERPDESVAEGRARSLDHRVRRRAFAARGATLPRTARAGRHAACALEPGQGARRPLHSSPAAISAQGNPAATGTRRLWHSRVIPRRWRQYLPPIFIPMYVRRTSLLLHESMPHPPYARSVSPTARSISRRR